MKDNSTRVFSKILFYLVIANALYSCSVSKENSTSLITGKWKCISNFPFNGQESPAYNNPMPCFYDLILTENGITLLDDRGDNGAWNYKIKNNTIFITNEEFVEAFKIKTITSDTLILVRTSEFSNYNKPLSLMTFIKER